MITHSIKNKNMKLWVFTGIAGIAIVFLLLELAHVINFIKLPKKSGGSSQGPTPEQKKQEDAANAETKKELIEKQGQTDQSPAPAATKAIDLSSKQESNNTVTVFTKLTGYNNGSCKLTVTNGAKSTSQTATLIYQPEFSSCAGFSVPIDAVGKGIWSLQLVVTSGGTSETKTISQEVK